MSEDQNRTIAQRCMEEFWGQGDASVADEIFAEDCAFQVPSAPPMGRGPKTAVEFMAYVRSAFEDFTTTVDRVVADGDVAVVYGSGQGIQVGEVLGARPRGEKVTMTGVLTLRIADGKIVEYRADWDTAAFARQLGI